MSGCCINTHHTVNTIHLDDDREPSYASAPRCLECLRFRHELSFLVIDASTVMLPRDHFGMLSFIFIVVHELVVGETVLDQQQTNEPVCSIDCSRIISTNVKSVKLVSDTIASYSMLNTSAMLAHN